MTAGVRLGSLSLPSQEPWLPRTLPEQQLEHTVFQSLVVTGVTFQVSQAGQVIVTCTRTDANGLPSFFTFTRAVRRVPLEPYVAATCGERGGNAPSLIAIGLRGASNRTAHKPDGPPAPYHLTAEYYFESMDTLIALQK